MKESMIKLITAALKKESWTLDDISNYGIARSMGGVYTLTMWRNKKTMKGDKKSVLMKIDNNMKHMFLAVETIEFMMHEHHNSKDFTARLDDIENEEDSTPAAFK